MRLRWLSVVAGLGLGLSSCSFDDGGVEPDGSDAVDASIDAEPPVCVPGCEGDILVTCPAGGAQRTECDLGCVADDDPHCAVMVPSNGVTLTDLDVVPNGMTFTVPAGETYTIDTDTGRIEDEDGTQIRPATTGGGVHAATGTFYAQRGTLGLFAVDALTVEAGGVLQGEGDRALIVLSRGDIVVRGTIDFSAGCRSGVGGGVCGGPGGGVGATTVATTARGCGPGGNGAGSPAPDEDGVESGAGGGGFGAAGASGGRGGTQGMPRAGGAGGGIAGCSGQTLVPLVGGSGGGAGGIGDVNGGAGGGGGGALQLSSFTRVSVDAGDDADAPAILRASGAGGTGPVAGAQGGGGGGSGGAILIEGPVIELSDSSVVVANGGGGGSGTVPSSNPAANGAAGGITTARAAGGIGEAAENNRGFGGVGGARSGAAGGGGPTLDGGGGGGGGVGIIRVNRRTQTIGGDALVSPAHSEGALTVQ